MYACFWSPTLKTDFKIFSPDIYSDSISYNVLSTEKEKYLFILMRKANQIKKDS